MLAFQKYLQLLQEQQDDPIEDAAEMCALDANDEGDCSTDEFPKCFDAGVSAQPEVSCCVTFSYQQCLLPFSKNSFSGSI